MEDQATKIYIEFKFLTWKASLVMISFIIERIS